MPERAADNLLVVDDLTVRYSGLPVIRDVSIQVPRGGATAVVGANGAGKSTLLKAVMGAVRPSKGGVTFDGYRIERLRTEQIVRRGLVYVPEDRKLFKPLTVEENLLLGAFTLDDEAQKKRLLDWVYELFPRLKERRAQAVGSMSGGEQQMAAIGRGLMSNPKLLMLDEPSLGLAPLMVSEVFETVRVLTEQWNITVLLVEQNVLEALELSAWAYVLASGELRSQGPSEEVLKSADIQKAFLGM